MTLLEVPVKILAITGLEKSKYLIEMAASWCCAVASVDLSRWQMIVLYESVLFIGTQFSNLYTAVDTPAEAPS
jgi:hypothetical protein